MGTILLYLLIASVVIASLAQAWIGVAAYYTLAIWNPQAVWFWIFGDIRVSLFVSLAGMVGCGIAIVARKIDFGVLKDRQNLYIALLWLFLNLSFYFNPYGSATSGALWENSSYLISLCNKILFFYFIAILLIDTPKKLYFLALILAMATAYHTYWANNQYLSGAMYGPRLAGPVDANGGGMYIDENAYAMLFVTGIPFLYFLGSYGGSAVKKYLFWAVIPFAWHAIFLTGSRGGLLGLAVVTIMIVLLSKSKVIGVAVLAGLITAFLWQGGSIMKERSATMVEGEEDASVQARYDSWAAAKEMIKKYPVTGVGIGNFVRAFPDFSQKQTHVAHNTFLQFASESGIVPGVVYLLICFNIIPRLFRKHGRTASLASIDPILEAVHKSVLSAMTGFFVCSMFLNLGIYEIFYYLLVLDLVLRRIAKKQAGILLSQLHEGQGVSVGQFARTSC